MVSNDLITRNYTNKNASQVIPNFASGDFTLSDGVLAEIKKEIPDFLPLTTEKVGMTK